MMNVLQKKLLMRVTSWSIITVCGSSPVNGRRGAVLLKEADNADNADNAHESN